MGYIRTNYLTSEEIQEKEDKLTTAFLHIQSEEIKLQVETPDTEETDGVSIEENNVSVMTEAVENESPRKRMLVVGVMIGVVCVAGGFVFIRRRREENRV